MVRNFRSDFDEYGYVVFVIAQKAQSKRKYRLVGFSNGVIKRVSFDKLKVTDVLKLNMMMGEKLTCGFYSDNDKNFAMGTSYGNVFIASLNQYKSKMTATYCVIPNICKANQLSSIKHDKASENRFNIDLDNDEQPSSANLSEFEKNDS